LLALALLGWAVSFAFAAVAGYVRTALSSMQVSVGKPTGVTEGR
jgi:hypothetical protein